MKNVTKAKSKEHINKEIYIVKIKQYQIFTDSSTSYISSQFTLVQIKIKLRSLRTVNILLRKGMGHTAVSATYYRKSIYHQLVMQSL